MAYAFDTGVTVAATHSLRARLQAGGSVVGAALYLGSPVIAEMMGQIGLDFVYIDQQHGLTSYDTMLALVRATDRSATSPIVRVAANDAALIGQALDAGADGVIVPMVNSRAEAERAVAACRYGPAGMRSYGPLRAAITRGGNIREADARILCIAMVETAAGVAQVEDIARTPGLDGIYIGQADLAVSLGLEPELRVQPGPHAEAIGRIVAACHAAGIAAGVSGDPAAMTHAGFRFVTSGSDHGFVAAGLKSLREKLAAQKTRKDNP